VYLSLPNVTREWDARDRGLAEGLLAYEAGLMPHGIPAEIALDPDNDGWFDAVPVTDHAQAAIERAQKENKDPEPGLRYGVRYTRNDPKPTVGDPADEQ